MASAVLLYITMALAIFDEWVESWFAEQLASCYDNLGAQVYRED